MVHTRTDRDIGRTVARTGHCGWARVGDDSCSGRMNQVIGDRNDRVETG